MKLYGKVTAVVVLSLIGLSLSGCNISSSNDTPNPNPPGPVPIPEVLINGQVVISLSTQAIADQEIDFLAEVQNQGPTSFKALGNNSSDTITISSVSYPESEGVTVTPIQHNDLPTGETLCEDGTSLTPNQNCFLGFKAQGGEGANLSGNVSVSMTGAATQTLTLPVDTTFVGSNDRTLPTVQIGTVNIAPGYTTTISAQNTGDVALENLVLNLPQWLKDVIDTEQAKTLRITTLAAGEAADFTFTLTGQEAINALSQGDRLEKLNDNLAEGLISIAASNLQGGTVYPNVNATLTPIFATDVYFTEPDTPQTIILTNDSSQDMQYQDKSGDPPTGVTITNDSCIGQTLSENDSCTIQVTATAQATDIQLQVIDFEFKDTNDTVFTATSQVQVSPVTVTMDVPASMRKPPIGSDPNTATITVTNTGNFDLASEDIGAAVAIDPVVTGATIIAGASDNCLGMTALAPSARCNLQLQVTDQASVSVEKHPIVLDALQLQNYNGANISHSFTIAGEAGHILIEQNGKSIHSIIIEALDSSEKEITIRNVGVQDLEFGANAITMVWQTGSAGNLPIITNDNCSGQTLAENATCAFTLQGVKDASITEDQEATLTVTSTNGDPLTSEIDVTVEPYVLPFLPQTGQTSTTPLDPAPAGSDGAVQAGVKWDIATRFIDNGNDTVTDTLTGLVWQQDPSVNNDNETLNWQTALNTCNNLNQGGQTDWRLPNVLELSSLVDLAVASPAEALNGNGFVSVGDTYGYWTSSTSAPNAVSVWFVNFVDGHVSNRDKPGGSRAWCVRSDTLGSPAPLWQTGQNASTPINPAPAGSDGAVRAGVAWDIATRFEVNGDVITDTLTGLQWQQNPSVNSGGNTLDWQTALTTCNSLEQGGQTDWRLPNRTELYSLVDWAAANPAANALNDNGFEGVRANNYWTSSSYAPNSIYAWVVNFYDGSVFHDFKTYDFYNRAWCVRGGL